jgi:drug/metabolite transporter (DMT)-like permease
MSTGVLVVLATVLYAAFATFTSRAGGRVDSRLSSGILNGVGAVLPLLIWLALRATRRSMIPTRPSGIIFSVLAGATVGVFTILLVTIYGRGGELSFVFPVIYGGAIALTAIVGWAVFSDNFSWLHLVGVTGIVAGIGLLAVPIK